MKKFKYIPLAASIAVALTSNVTLAADAVSQSDLEARISELESKLEKSDYLYKQDQQVLTPDVDPKLGFFFSGYARYGAVYETGDNSLVNVGSSGRSVGRLGNEENGGEIQFAQVGKSDSGAIWDIVVMFDQWDVSAWGAKGGVNLKKMYAGATNFVESQPELYVWAGRDFHQRPQQGLNDYFWMTHDGQGAGFNNLKLGGMKFNMAFVGQVADGSGGALGDDSGRYAITSKLHDIGIGLGKLDLYANYGFASKKAGAAVDPETAFQLGAVWNIDGPHKVTAKYADGADNSAFDLAGDKQVFYISYEGGFNSGDKLYVDYLVSYKSIAGDDATDTTEYSGIIRPMYSWDKTHSTWFEAGYAMEDYDDGDKSGWKATLSQNISLGGLPWSRPMVRAYATVGDVTTSGSGTGEGDTFNVGAMFEAWW